MTHDVARHDRGMARDDVVAERNQRFDLPERIVVMITVQVHDLDPDRTAVQRLAAAPA